MTPARNLLMYGEGSTTRLAMLPQYEDVRHDWWLIQVSGAGHVLRDFAVDGTTRGVTGEQTHLLQLRGPASDIRLERLTLYLPVQRGNSGGDCIRLLGEHDKRVENITIVDVHGVECARSFIALQRHVANVTIERVISDAVGGQAIDMEPTGDGAIERVVIRGARLARGAVARGGYTVALAGSRSRLSQHLVLEDSEIEAGIQVYRAHDVAIRRNRISGGYPRRAMIKVMQDSREVLIENNTLLRTRSEGDAIELSVHHERWPRNVKISNNTIVMEHDGYPIHAEPAEALEVSSNEIVCHAGGRAAVYLRGVGAAIDRIRIHKNQISGGCLTGVRITQHGAHVTRGTVIEENIIDDAVTGIEFENGAPSQRPVIRRNVFRGVQVPKHVVGAEAPGR